MTRDVTNGPRTAPRARAMRRSHRNLRGNPWTIVQSILPQARVRKLLLYGRWPLRRRGTFASRPRDRWKFTLGERTMTNVKLRVAWLVPWVLAGATVLATNVQAQAGTNAAQGAEDMRLWSFGDCDRRFPYVNTDEHQECVRVVGSEEAKDARALRVCAVSHALDPVENERCKSSYLANKQKAAQDGVVAGTP